MTIKTNDLDATIEHVEKLLEAYAPDTSMQHRKTWSNERAIEITSGDKSKTYDIELGLGRSDRPLVAAAKIIDDWRSLNPTPYEEVLTKLEKERPPLCPNCGRDLSAGGELGHWAARGPFEWCEPTRCEAVRPGEVSKQYRCTQDKDHGGKFHADSWRVQWPNMKEQPIDCDGCEHCANFEGHPKIHVVCLSCAIQADPGEWG